MNLQGARRKLLKYFGGSNFWTAWSWVKTEWLLTRKNQRIWFLQECRRKRLVPRFVLDKIRTAELLDDGNEGEIRARQNFGLQILRCVIKREFAARGRLLRSAQDNKKDMFRYNRAEYIFVKQIMERVTRAEITDSRSRLSRKISKLLPAWKRESEREPIPRKERVSCIDCVLSDAERNLLEKGPTFVPSRKRMTAKELRALESEIETTASILRWRAAESLERTDVKVDEESRALLQDPKIRKLKPGNHRVTQYKTVGPDIENNLRRFKDNIMKAFQRFRPRKSNLSVEERSALKTLREKDVIIKRSDKSKSLVVMNRDTYKQKCRSILDNRENYEVTEMTREILQKKAEEELKNLSNLKETLPAEVYRGLLRKDARLPEFYGLPKIHKADNPLRPVVAAFDSPLSGISILLERILNQLLRFVPAHIGNTLAATKSLNNAFPGLKVPADTIIVTMDVVALYPSIPIRDGIVAVMEKIKKHQADIDLVGLTLNEIEQLLDFILHNNYFKFDNIVYRQREGVAMGNHLAPPFAILFMDKLEQKMLATAEKKPEFYDRYVDDCLMAWLHGEENLKEFIKHCNNQHPHIKFTWNHSLSGKPVDFMDLAITINEELQLEYELFQKPSDSGVGLNFNSSVPTSQKLSVATQHFRRAASLSSSEAKEQSSAAKISSLLRNNDYPLEAIERAYQRSKQQPLQREEHRETVTLKLPYRGDELHREVRKLCSKTGLPIEPVYHRPRSLQRILIRSAFVSPTCEVHERFVQQQNAAKRSRGKPRDDCITCRAGLSDRECDRTDTVYLMKCSLCDEHYVGETSRKLRERTAEHHFQARNRKSETAWGEHMKQVHPSATIGKAPIFNVELIATSRNDVTRKFREAVEIRDRQPTINRNQGWSLM